MLITKAPKRCSQCKNILKVDEVEQRWCNSCRKKENIKYGRKKDNKETRDSIAKMFGYDRKSKREEQ